MIRFTLFFVVLALIPTTTSIKITILHTNDVHSRFLSYNLQTKSCTNQDIDEHHCWGGAARRMSAIEKVRENYENVILLDAGDQYQGTRWYTSLKWEPISTVMNAMNYTVMTFGNHEFDDGLHGLVPFVKNLSFPVVSTNVISDGTDLQDTYLKVLELQIENETVAFVGYTSTETPTLANPGDSVQFLDEIKTLQTVVNELKLKGINKVIALGHSGIQIDRLICQQVDGIDVIIGGHTHTFLYTGTPPSFEKPEGPYPEVFKKNGSTCLLAHSYAYGKYLGFLQVNFDVNGIIDSWNGKPILIDDTYPEDPYILQVLEKFQTKYDSFDKVIVGQTAVTLDAKTIHCRLQECNVGNVITDSMFYYYLKQKWAKNLNSSLWSDANFAVINGGGVRGFYADAGTNITIEDLYVVSPFSNTVELIQIKGQYILEAFEHSVNNYSFETRHGKFLQVSGAKVVYDLSQPNGKRVRSLSVLCNECSIPTYEQLVPDKIYNMITVTFLCKGGDGYKMIKDNVINSDRSQTLDIDLQVDYIKKHQPLTTGIEGRILFVTDLLYQSNCKDSN